MSLDSWYSAYLSIEQKLNEIEQFKEIMMSTGKGMLSFPPVECVHDGSSYDLNPELMSTNSTQDITDYYCSLTKIGFLFSTTKNEDENNFSSLCKKVT